MQCSVLDVEAEVLVNAANSALAGGSGVDGAIHRAAGPELYTYCRSRLGKCRVGDAKLSPAFRIASASHIIHTVGPAYSEAYAPQAEADLRSCYRSTLALLPAEAKSIAFPGISTGRLSYPIQKAAAIAVEEVLAYLRAAPSTKLQEVVFAAYAADEFACYWEVLEAKGGN